MVHDHYCATKIRSWVDTHNAFYDAMIASGESVNRARVMWAAVYRFGPRWAQNQSVCWGVCADNDAYLEDVDVLPTFNKADFRKIKSHVERNRDKTLSELAEFIDQNAEQSSSGARLRGVLQDINGDRGPVDFKAPNNWYYYGNFRRAPRILPIYETVNVAPKESLNVHGGPGSQFPVVGRIPSDGRGLRLVVPCGRAAWCQVRHGETEGWVESSFIRIDPELSKLEH